MNGASTLRLMFAQASIFIAKYLAWLTDASRAELEKTCEGVHSGLVHSCHLKYILSFHARTLSTYLHTLVASH